MPVTLEDLLNLPENPTDEHLNKLGLLKPPPEQPSFVPPAKVPTVTYSNTPMAGAPTVTPRLESRSGVEAAHERPTLKSMPLPPINLDAAPDFGNAGAPPVAGNPLPSVFGAPNLDYKQQMALPTISGAVHPGTSQFFENQLERQETAKEHPATGVKGAFEKAGNIALDVFAPGVAAAIPGTDIFKRLQEERTFGNLEKAKNEETREKHEENISETNQEKLREAQEKIDETENKDKSQREIALRKQGLKLDENGKAVPLQYEDMSESEQAVHDLKVAQAESQTARAALDKIKADPQSPQNQAALARIRTAAQNAATAAGKLGLDKEKFVADYFGLDKEGNPLPGAQTDESGHPIGPRMVNASKGALSSFNKDYVKPAEDVEKSYQMMNNAYNDYKAAKAKGEELPTGAESMLALSTHLSTTFGNVKGSRVTKDMIEHHLGARSIPDSALVAVQKLTNGDVLSPDQWDAFHKLIGESRKLSWTTAVKEGKRANLPIDFLPEDLKDLNKGEAKPHAATPTTPATHPTEPPRPPAAGMKWQHNKKTGEFREVPIGG